MVARHGTVSVEKPALSRQRQILSMFTACHTTLMSHFTGSRLFNTGVFTPQATPWLERWPWLPPWHTDNSLLDMDSKKVTGTLVYDEWTLILVLYQLVTRGQMTPNKDNDEANHIQSVWNSSNVWQAQQIYIYSFTGRRHGHTCTHTHTHTRTHARTHTPKSIQNTFSICGLWKLPGDTAAQLFK